MQLPTKLLSAWCNHKRKHGDVLHSKNKSIVQHLALILPCIGKIGIMSEWVHFALDNGYWKILISNLGNSPKLRPVDVPSPSSSRNENWRYFPPNSPSVNQDSFLSPPSTTVRRRPQARNSPKNSPSSTTGQNIHFPAATITPDTAHTVHPSKVEIRFLPERSGEDKK